MRERLPPWGFRVKALSRATAGAIPPAWLAEHLSTHPLLSHRSAPLACQGTSQCKSPQTAIAEQKQLSFNHQQPWEINPG